jgi:anti-sigma B factor antagonist
MATVTVQRGIGQSERRTLMTMSERLPDTTGLDWSVSTVHPGGPTVIRLRGEVDLEVAADLQGCLIGGAERTDIVIDLSEVSLLDCSCLGVMIRASNRAQLQGHQVTLTAPTPTVRRTLSATGADTALPVLDDQPQVVRLAQRTARLGTPSRPARVPVG